MTRRAIGRLFAASFVAATQRLNARPKNVAAIDEYCQRLKLQFLEAEPDFFVGPNPWTRVDRPPTKLQEGIFATVYSTGPSVRWLILLLKGANHTWAETAHYFFGADGVIVKRERFLEALVANTALDETLYYEHGQLISESTQHRSLGTGRENGDLFDDPEAPDFTNSNELPFPFDEDRWQHLA